MIQAKSITQFFSVVKPDGTAEGTTAVLSASLEIAERRIVSLVGPSGCGKSTFLEILAGLQIPSEGVVSIDGEVLREPIPTNPSELESYRKKYRFRNPVSNNLFRNHHRHGLAMIFQDYAVFPWLTALENVTFALDLCGVPRSEQIRVARHHLARLGLQGSEDKFPAQLSGGMRQRLALARAFSIQPRILLMDEPFSALDVLTRERLQEDLLHLWEKQPTTIVFVTHDLQEAIYLSDEVVVFSPQPGTIRNRIPIDLPRPRRRSSPEFLELLVRLEAIYHYDLKQECDYSI